MAPDQPKTDVRMRPRLERRFKVKPEELLERLRANLRAIPCRCSGNVLDNQVEMLIKRQFRHFWSPWFSGLVTRDGDAGALLRGRFGPHPSIWTAIATGYAALSFGTFVAVMFATSQWMIGASPWALWFVGGFGLLALSVYAVARVGRRLAREQIGWMLRYLDCSIEEGGECGEIKCAACPLWAPPESEEASTSG